MPIPRRKLHAATDANAHNHCDRHANGYGYGNNNAYTYCDRHAYGYGHINTYAVTDTFSHAYAHEYSNANSNARRVRGSQLHRHQDTPRAVALERCWVHDKRHYYSL
jgi:hypothetical protein